MHRDQCCRAAEFDGEVPIAHSVHGILRELRLAFGIDEPEEFRYELAVQR